MIFLRLVEQRSGIGLLAIRYLKHFIKWLINRDLAIEVPVKFAKMGNLCQNK